MRLALMSHGAHSADLPSPLLYTSRITLHLCVCYGHLETLFPPIHSISFWYIPTYLQARTSFHDSKLVLSLRRNTLPDPSKHMGKVSTQIWVAPES
jgi:hypothetical protein